MRKSQVKFRSAEEKRRHEELAKSWNEMNAKWMSVSKTSAVRKSKPLSMESNVYRRETTRLPSHGMVGNATKSVEGKVYTGTAMMGIGTLHKSNAVPVFSSDEATEIARMRR